MIASDDDLPKQYIARLIEGDKFDKPLATLATDNIDEVPKTIFQLYFWKKAKYNRTYAE